MINTAFFLLDNGNFSQGQPTVYYYNFIDTIPRHLSARVMNYMEYDAGTVGNHDPYLNENATYEVAINSYWGNGGGGQLAEGVKIAKENLADRITWSTDIDLRYYMMNYLSLKDILHPELYTNWQLTPHERVKSAAISEWKLFE